MKNIAPLVGTLHEPPVGALQYVPRETNHKGINVIRLNIINNGWYWEGLNKDIALFIQDCSLCSQINSTKYLKPPIKQIISTNHERYIIDIWELPPEITNIYPYKYIIDIIDHFQSI